ELQQLCHLHTALAHEVGARDPAVDDAVLYVLGDVRSANEQHVDRRVAARERERPLARLLGAEPCVVEKRDRRLAQPALRRHRDRQAVVLRRFMRSSSKRYPSSPCRSQCATRVTVVVDACVRRLISRYGKPSSSSRATCQRCAIASSSDRVQRSRRKRPTSSAFLSDATASHSSVISWFCHGCEGSPVAIGTC